MCAQESEASDSWQKELDELLAFEDHLRYRLQGWTRNRADVEEILQETYTRILARIRDGAKPVAFVRAFSLTTARNVARDLLRHQDILEEVEFDEELLEEYEPSAEEQVAADQEMDQLIQVLKELPARRRQVLVLRKVYGYSQKQIATLLGIAENTVEQHITKAIRELAAGLGPAPAVTLRFPIKRPRIRGHIDSASASSPVTDRDHPTHAP